MFQAHIISTKNSISNEFKNLVTFSYLEYTSTKNKFLTQSTHDRRASAVAGGSLGFLLLGEVPDVPETKGFISGGRAHLASIGRKSHVKDALGVTGEFSNLSHRGVVPETELVLRVTMSTENFLGVRAPDQRAYLTASVDLVNHATSDGVVESDVTIGGTGASGEDVSFEGAPSQGLDSSVSISEGVPGSRLTSVPDLAHVVV